MQNLKIFLLLISVALLKGCGSDDGSFGVITRELEIPQTGYETPESYEGMTLVWQDEFDGSSLNESNWTFEIGDGCPGLCGWGNNELQSYHRENVSLTDGHLVIEARRESVEGSDYSSARIITKDKQEFRYGRIDIRAAMPRGKGMWPALWMLGSNIDEVSWPRCGEIDIMEMVGGTETTVHGTVHWQGDAYATFGSSKTLEDGSLSGEFHVYSIDWNEDRIRWFIDDEQYHLIDITPEQLSEFRQRFFFIFNIAVGGNWPGNPDGSTQFPQWMIVDYVRVFQFPEDIGGGEPEPPESVAEFLVDFEGDNPEIIAFGNNNAQVIFNPDVSGINTSDNVLEVVHGDETWGGQFFDLSGPLDLTAKTKISCKVWAPGADFDFRLKIENQANDQDFHEYDLPIDGESEWVELTFDLTSDLNGASAVGGNYGRIVFFPGWNVANAGTFYVDDIQFVE